MLTFISQLTLMLMLTPTGHCLGQSAHHHGGPDVIGTYTLNEMKRPQYENFIRHKLQLLMIPIISSVFNMHSTPLCIAPVTLALTLMQVPRQLAVYSTSCRAFNSRHALRTSQNLEFYTVYLTFVQNLYIKQGQPTSRSLFLQTSDNSEFEVMRMMGLYQIDRAKILR